MSAVLAPAPDVVAPDRKTYIGGSDAASVLGVSNWRTKLQTYFAKRGDVLPAEVLGYDPVRERILRRGKLMEPVIVEMMIAEIPIKVTKRSTPENPNRYIDAELPYVAAEIDFEWEVTPEIIAHFELNGVVIDPALLGTIQNGEVKSAHPFVAAKKFGEEGTDEIPIEYAAQAMHGLLTTGRQITLFPVLVGSDNLIFYWVKRDDEQITGMRKIYSEFWNGNVLAGVPPDPVDIGDVYSLFRRKQATLIEATPEIAAAVTAMRILQARHTMAEEGIDALKYEIGCFMVGDDEIRAPSKSGAHVLTFAGESILEIVLQEQSRIDQDLLERDHPDIARKCTKGISFFVYRKPRKPSQRKK